jgi:protein-tyrosine-phosphatase
LSKKVLFVCTGNTCRSPMAEGLLKRMAQENRIPLEVQSAGLAAFAGVPATPEAIEACREKGVDISSHLSQPLNKTLVTESDLILTMTGKHKEMIVKKMPPLEP